MVHSESDDGNFNAQVTESSQTPVADELTWLISYAKLLHVLKLPVRNGYRAQDEL